MNIGVSSSCFYPLEAEKAFMNLAQLGIKTTEVFFNSPSELEAPFLKEINQIKADYGMDIVSFHPYMSFAEGFFIFSEYKRRFYDSLEMYKPFFNAAAQLGARYYIMHGSKNFKILSCEEYAERFALFKGTAKQYGVEILHENVVDYVGQSPEFMLELKRILGDEFAMVLDVKQARRAGVDTLDFVRKLGTSIKHLHLSDCDSKHDCLPPSASGSFDFVSLFTELEKIGYSGDGMVEVYRKNFTVSEQLKDAANYLQNIADSI